MARLSGSNRSKNVAACRLGITSVCSSVTGSCRGSPELRRSRLRCGPLAVHKKYSPIVYRVVFVVQCDAAGSGNDVRGAVGQYNLSTALKRCTILTKLGRSDDQTTGFDHAHHIRLALPRILPCPPRRNAETASNPA